MRPHFVLGVLIACLPIAAQTATHAVFTNLSLAVQPPDRSGAMMAHDPVRGRTLLTGGAGSGLDGQSFFVQGAVLVSGWNPAGAVMSDSRRGTAGVL